MRNLKTAAVLEIAVMGWLVTACSDMKSPTRPGPDGTHGAPVDAGQRRRHRGACGRTRGDCRLS